MSASKGRMRKAFVVRSATVLMAVAVAIGVRGALAEIAAESIDGSLLKRIAWVRAATKVCTDDAAAMSGHLVQAYDDWLKRNAQIREVVEWLDSASTPPTGKRMRATYERTYDETIEIFETKQRSDPEDFSIQCDELTKELADGVYDASQSE